MDLFSNKCLFASNKGDFGSKSPHKQKKTFFFPNFRQYNEPHWAPLSPIEPNWAPLSRSDFLAK